jgi:hypothetical protein
MEKRLERAPEVYDSEIATADAWGTADMADDSEAESAKQAALLREIFGNPFRQVGVEHSWISPQVVNLAKAIYDQQAFEQMPELSEGWSGRGAATGTFTTTVGNRASMCAGAGWWIWFWERAEARRFALAKATRLCAHV